MDQVEAFIKKLDLILLQVTDEMPGNSVPPYLIYLGNRILDFILAEYHSTCCAGFFNLGNVYLFGNSNQADAVWISP